jgi:transcriptional regulator with XRE-family HTH domain
VREDAHIGARIADERKLRGLTQHQLANRAHVSLSLLRKVEQGSRPASSALVASAARVLGIEQARLTGQPYLSGDRKVDALHDQIPNLRRELTMYGLPPDDEVQLVDLDRLAVRVAESSELVHGASYARLSRILPGLLEDLRAASHATTGEARVGVMSMLFEVYDNAKRLAYDLGYADLGTLAASLEERAAAEADDLLAVAVARGVRAWTLTGAGAFGAAYRLLVNAADDVPGDSPERWSVWGFLNLQAALSSARSGDTARTWDHYVAAQEAASRMEVDRDDYRLAFGPANTAIWGVGLAVELQDGPAAVARAQNVVIPDYLPRARAGHHFLDLARGHLYNGDREAALGALLTARRIAPQQARYSPMARETVYALARVERRSSQSLRGLAAWMGIQD